MGKREEISDVIIDRAYTDKDKEGKYVFHVGRLLTFDYEGSPIHIRVTKIDRKNKRMWGEHITLYDLNTGMTHYGHDIDASDDTKVICRDCNVEVNQPNTEEGEVKALERAREEAKKEEAEEAIKDKHRRFHYERLKGDGTIEDFGTTRRKKMGEVYKILKCEMVERISGAYFKEPWVGKSVGFADIEGPLKTATRNPHFVVLKGDPALEEPEEMFVVGDVLMMTEVTKVKE